MKNLSVLLCVVVVSALIFVAAPGLVCAQDKPNSILVGGYGLVGPDVSASAVPVAYERQLADRFSLTVRQLSGGYDYDDGYYEEEGDFQGIGAGFRFYTSGEMKGFFIGGGADIWTSEWDWIDDKGTAYESSGSGDSTGLNVSFRIGYRFMLAPAFFVEPGGQIGYFFNESEISIYAIGGVAVGIRF